MWKPLWRIAASVGDIAERLQEFGESNAVVVEKVDMIAAAHSVRINQLTELANAQQKRMEAMALQVESLHERLSALEQPTGFRVN